jgi:radical SAM superfamily enzyme YgiQ (UPF0313 family)
MPDILLATINAKWIHPSLALRLLKSNLGLLEQKCEIVEFALRQPLSEKINPVLLSQPRILGLSVSIWNHIATLEMLRELRRIWESKPEQQSACLKKPLVILGGPEVSYLPPDAEIFNYADYCIRGEGEIAFRELCEAILGDENSGNELKVLSEKRENFSQATFVNLPGSEVNAAAINYAYCLYTAEDLCKKLIYVEASRGCPFGCEFCLSVNSPQLREFPLESFFIEMDDLINRGAKIFKFLDRSFNLNIERAQRIMEFFLERIENKRRFIVHFEMVPSRFPPELIDTLARFPPGTLRLEIGIQTLNPDVSARVCRFSKTEQELVTLRLLREKTRAIIHADLIAGLPGEDMASIGRGFDSLWDALWQPALLQAALSQAALFQASDNNITDINTEIQLGILKLLPGTPLARHTNAFAMRYMPMPPYELLESSAITACELNRIKNFARFWEQIINRGLMDIGCAPVFNRFMTLSDFLFTRCGRNWGIPKDELVEAIRKFNM